MKVKGAISFEALRTVNAIIHDTFKSLCIALSLYDSDDGGMPTWKKQLACK
jgi:hypothetical protein